MQTDLLMLLLQLLLLLLLADTGEFLQRPMLADVSLL
jgi:hypothetical protein